MASFDYLNHTTVKELLESGDEDARANLLQNTRLTEASYVLLAGEPDVEQVDAPSALKKETQIRKYRPDISRIRHTERFKNSSFKA